MKFLAILTIVCISLWTLAITLEERSNKRD
jgi:hypothetical protein